MSQYADRRHFEFVNDKDEDFAYDEDEVEAVGMNRTQRYSAVAPRVAAHLLKIFHIVLDDA